MINLSAFRSGSDFVIKELGVGVHQPTYKEISIYGDYDLMLFCNIINLSKEDFITNKEVLEKVSDFEVIMEILSKKENKEEKRVFKNYMSILFKNYKIEYGDHEIFLYFYLEEEEEPVIITINKDNFIHLKNYINIMFPVFGGEVQKYNTCGKEANRIKEKLLEAARKRKELNMKKDSDDEVIDIFGRYCLIIAVGLSLDYDKLTNCTIFQLISLYESYTAKRSFEHYLKALEAGAKNVKEVKDWVELTAFDFNL